MSKDWQTRTSKDCKRFTFNVRGAGNLSGTSINGNLWAKNADFRTLLQCFDSKCEILIQLWKGPLRNCEGPFRIVNGSVLRYHLKKEKNAVKTSLDWAIIVEWNATWTAFRTAPKESREIDFEWCINLNVWKLVLRLGNDIEGLKISNDWISRHVTLFALNI